MDTEQIYNLAYEGSKLIIINILDIYNCAGTSIILLWFIRLMNKFLLSFSINHYSSKN